MSPSLRFIKYLSEFAADSLSAQQRENEKMYFASGLIINITAELLLQHVTQSPLFVFVIFYLNILLIGSTLKCNAEGEINQLFDIFVKEESSVLNKYCYQPEKSYFWGGIKRKKKLPRERPLTDLGCDDCQDKRRKMQLQYFNINSPKFNARLDTYWPSIYVLPLC